jgi:hypothetical protein
MKKAEECPLRSMLDAKRAHSKGELLNVGLAFAKLVIALVTNRSSNVLANMCRFDSDVFISHIWLH